MSVSDGYLPTLDSVLEAAALVQAMERHDPSFGDQLLAATPGTAYALAIIANHAISGLAKLAGDTPDEVLHELRLIITEVVAQMTNEGKTS